uniref:Transcriptional regulator n=1 Tax=Salinispora mooreana TaxID=999545 RepID=A0A0F6Y569_9ACTN|nr:transcriptional regulator [Salinispora mooreana]
MTGTGLSMADHDLQFFELLARDAPVPRYEDVVQQAQRDGVDRSTLNRIMMAKRLALELREVVGRRDRRRVELAALVDTARDLAGASDLQAGLRLVVRRAQLLLALDVAFVSLVDDTVGDSYVASAVGAAGTLTDGFRLPWRNGLVVPAEGGQPISWTADYLTDECLERHPITDSLIRGEGLCAVLSVALTVDGRHLGDLHVGHRQIRHFTPDEVASLRLLADLATTAMDRIRVLSDTSADLKQAQQEAAQARAELSVVREAGSLQPALTQLVLDGGGLDDIVTRTVRSLGGALHIRDRAGDVLAAVGDLPTPDERELARARLRAYTTNWPGRLTTGSWVFPLAARTDDLGYVLFHPEETFDHERVAALPGVAQTTAMLLLVQNIGAQDPSGDQLLEGLLGPLPGPDADGKQGQPIPVELDRPHVVVVARPEGVASPQMIERAVSVAHGLDGMKAMRGDHAVMSLPGEDPGAAAREVARELGGLLGLPVTAGGAGPVRTTDLVRRAYQEALRCVGALVALDATGRAVCSQDLGFLGLLVADGHDVPGFINRVLGPVLTYDAHRFTNLAETLEVYFDSGGSRARAAEMLHVHPNTVSRRLDRITQLLGRDWQQPDRAMDTQLALRLHRVRDLLSQEWDDPRWGPGSGEKPIPSAWPTGTVPSATAGHVPRKRG